MAITKLPIEIGVEVRADEFRGNKVDVSRVRLTVLASDPTDLQDGDAWATSAGLRIRVGGVSKTVTAV